MKPVNKMPFYSRNRGSFKVYVYNRDTDSYRYDNTYNYRSNAIKRVRQLNHTIDTFNKPNLKAVIIYPEGYAEKYLILK